MENKNMENVENVEKGRVGDHSVEIIDGIQVINYSKGKSLHVRFNYRGTPTEENPEGSFEDGGHLEFKFKDPRDTLKFLTNNFELLGGVEQLILFDYVQFYEDEGFYSQLEIYYLLLLELKLPCIDCFIAKHPIPKKDFKDFTEEELENHKANCKQFRDEFEKSIREAHKFAVVNTWKVWNDIQSNVRRKRIDSSEVIVTEEDIKRVSIPKESMFDTNYKGREVSVAYGFNLYRRLWHVYFEDGSWVIAGDHGNGWYSAETNFNSYKLLER